MRVKASKSPASALLIRLKDAKLRLSSPSVLLLYFSTYLLLQSFFFTAAFAT